MTKALPSDRARIAVADQRAGLRERVKRCEQLADALDAGQIGPAPLLCEVSRLRAAFDAHHRCEGQLPRPLSIDADAPGPDLVARLAGDHPREHPPGKCQLGMSAPTSELRAALDSLRAYLEAEEQSSTSCRRSTSSGTHGRRSAP